MRRSHEAPLQCSVHDFPLADFFPMSDPSPTMDLTVALKRQAQVTAFQRRHRVALLTLVFTDIVGSTRLKQELGDQTAMRLLQRHHAVVRELLRPFGDAQEISTAGDSFFLIFAKPSDAVKFSLQLQARLRALAQETGTEVLDRIGVHVGEVVVEEQTGSSKARDLYGMQVDTCARVMSLAGPGRLLLTRFAFDNARQALRGETLEGVGALTWTTHGHYALKGVEEPLEICEVGECHRAPFPAPEDSDKAHRVERPSRLAPEPGQKIAAPTGLERFRSRLDHAAAGWRAQWRVAVGGAVLTAAVGLGFLVLPIGRPLTFLSYDLPFYFRRDIPVGDVAIVYMDDESHLALHQPDAFRWNRTNHARLIERLAACSAKAVVFDVLFDSPASAEEDAQLAQAAKTYGRVAFAAKIGPRVVEGVDVGPKTFVPIEPLRAVGPWGYVEGGGGDRFIREHFRATTNYPALSWKVAQLTLTNGLPDPLPPRWINYYGPPGIIPGYSFHEVLTGITPARAFSNKVVFVGARFSVGYTGGRGTDDFGTPYSRWTNQRSPGVEILATTYRNLAHHEWLEELSPGEEVLLVAALGAALGLGLALCRPVTALWAGALVSLCVATAAIALVWHTRVWFPWVIVCAVQTPVALAWSALAHTQRLRHEKDELARSLARATPALTSKTAAPAVAPPAEAGALQIPDHTLLRRIGGGAYGEVWRARDVIGTFHAVKVVHRSRFRTAEPFEREFRGIEKFTPISRGHPHWVHILHVGCNEAGGYFFYIMELADAAGQAREDEKTGKRENAASPSSRVPIFPSSSYTPRTLAWELAQRRKLPVAECVPLGVALASALEYLHAHGLVHRDIKPSNVIFVNGVPKFADIGLVTTAAREGADLSYVGTEGFIAPEGPGTPSADLYSLGKLLYEAAFGQDRNTFPALPSSLTEREDVSDLLELNKIILKACETDPRQRYPSAAAMKADLAALDQRVRG
jgi:class 3 adenylate cyclase/CHASE2 domain-containing sensor protein